MEHIEPQETDEIYSDLKGTIEDKKGTFANHMDETVKRNRYETIREAGRIARSFNKHPPEQPAKQNYKLLDRDRYL
jgi:hypothetical protein